MARPLRIDFPGAFHHVTNRGARRQDIFYCPQDRLAVLWGQVSTRDAKRKEPPTRGFGGSYVLKQDTNTSGR